MKEQNIKITFCQESQRRNKFGCAVEYRLLGGWAGDTEPAPSWVVTKRRLFKMALFVSCALPLIDFDKAS